MTHLQKILGLFALALAGTLLYLYLQSGWQEAAGPPRLLPGLEEQLAEVTKVVIEGAETSTLVRQETGWTIAEKHGYALDSAKFIPLLQALAEAELVESKTSKPELQARLGLATEGEDQAQTISIYTDAEIPAYVLLVGSVAPSRTGTYIKRPNDPQAWLASKNLTPPASSQDWLDLTIIDIDPAEIQKVELGLNTEAPLVAARAEEDGSMAIQDLPEDAQLRYPTIADNLARALASVRAQEVAPHNPDDWPDDDTTEARFTLKNGDQITAQTREADGAHHLHLAITPAAGSALAEATSIATWQYQISSYTHEQFTKTLPDLVEPKEAADQ